MIGKEEEHHDKGAYIDKGHYRKQGERVYTSLRNRFEGIGTDYVLDRNRLYMMDWSSGNSDATPGKEHQSFKLDDQLFA